VTADCSQSAVRLATAAVPAATTIRPEGCRHATVRSTTLDDIFAKHAIMSCELLKMDCEGAEHDILPAINVLAAVEWFSVEFHINSRTKIFDRAVADKLLIQERIG
jgi:FkbM family methyltransferase